jgi:antirestriction protein ArdC
VKERGGNVKKGEKASMVVFWKEYEVTDRETGEAKKMPVLRYYNVFNASQCDGIEVPDAVKFEPIDFKPIEGAEQIAGNYAGGPAVEHDGGQQAFYRPGTDTVHLPERTRFASVEEYYSTLFHELSHSTGHSSRLDRKLDTAPKPFGSPDYGKEELVAEMSAAFLCGHAGIQPTVIENQAAYLSGWLTQLKSDKKLVVSAAGQAQRAADWIRNERGERE